MSSLRRMSALLVALVLAIGLPIALPSAGGVARAGRAPFEAPARWATICDAARRAGAPLVRGTNCRWLELDGVWRRYLVYVPHAERFSLDRSWPVVIVLHGGGSSGEQSWTRTRWRDEAEAVGAIAVYPTAWRYERRAGHPETRWNTWALPDEILRGVRLDGYPPRAPYPARDGELARRILADIGGQLQIARDQVFASGFSNGGKFVSRLAVDLSDVLAAATCFAYCDGPPGSASIRRVVPLLYGFGTRDPLLLEDLRPLVDPDPVVFPLGWRDARPMLWSLIAGHLDAQGLDPGDAIVVETDHTLQVTWSGTGDREATPFRLLVLDGIGHVFPRRDENPYRFDMASISWRFFQEHRGG